MTRSCWRSWRQTQGRWRMLGPGDRSRLLEAAACLGLAQGAVWTVLFRRAAGHERFTVVASFGGKSSCRDRPHAG